MEVVGSLEAPVQRSPQGMTLLHYNICLKGFPGGASGTDPACQGRKQETRVRSPGQKDLLEEEIVTHSSILAWRIPKVRSLVGSRVHRVT